MKKLDKDTKFYRQHKHVVAGSLQSVKPGTRVVGFKAAHGRVCTISCVECGKKRLINSQDAFQVDRCVEHQAERAKARAAKRRKANRKK